MDSVSQLGFAKCLAAVGRRLPGLPRQHRDRRRPRLAAFRRMQIQPLFHRADQPTTAVMSRVEAAGEIIHDPVFFRFTGGLPLQHAFTGEAAAQLYNDLRLLQFAHRFAVCQPQVGARQRLPGLGKDVANQRPAERFCPPGDFFTFSGAHATRDDNAPLLSPEKPVALLFAFQMQGLPQPGFIALPPRAELLLPLHAGVIHLAVQRLGERTVDMDTAGMQSAQRLVNRRYQPARGHILRRTRQRQRLRGMRSKHARLADSLVRTAVNQLRGTIGGEKYQLFTGQPRLN